MTSLASEATPQSRTIRKHFSDLVTAVQDPVRLATELYSADIIVGSLLESVRDTLIMRRTDKTSKLLGAVSDRVFVKPDDFEKFLGILKCREPPLMEIVKDMEASYHFFQNTDNWGNQVRKRRPISPVIIGGSKKKLFPDSGVPGEDSPVPSHMGTFSTQRALKQRVHELEARFGALINKTRKEVNHSNVGLSTLLTFLAASIGEHQIHYFEGNMEAFLKASNIDDVFFQLNFYWDFLNYGLLEHIVEGYGNGELKREMVEYVADVACFRKATVLCDFVGVWHREHEIIPLNLRQMVSEHDSTLMDYTLEDLEQFRQKISVKLSLSKSASMVVKVEEGSVVITWLIPSSLVPQLREQLLGGRNILDELQREHQILMLTLDGHEMPLSPQEGVSTSTRRSSTTSSVQGVPASPSEISDYLFKRGGHREYDLGYLLLLVISIPFLLLFEPLIVLLGFEVWGVCGVHQSHRHDQGYRALLVVFFLLEPLIVARFCFELWGVDGILFGTALGAILNLGSLTMLSLARNKHSFYFLGGSLICLGLILGSCTAVITLYNTSEHITTAVGAFFGGISGIAWITVVMSEISRVHPFASRVQSLASVKHLISVCCTVTISIVYLIQVNCCELNSTKKVLVLFAGLYLAGVLMVRAGRNEEQCGQGFAVMLSSVCTLVLGYAHNSASVATAGNILVGCLVEMLAVASISEDHEKGLKLLIVFIVIVIYTMVSNLIEGEYIVSCVLGATLAVGFMADSGSLKTWEVTDSYWTPLLCVVAGVVVDQVHWCVSMMREFHTVFGIACGSVIGITLCSWNVRVVARLARQSHKVKMGGLLGMVFMGLECGLLISLFKPELGITGFLVFSSLGGFLVVLVPETPSEILRNILYDRPFML